MVPHPEFLQNMNQRLICLFGLKFPHPNVKFFNKPVLWMIVLALLILAGPSPAADVTNVLGRTGFEEASAGATNPGQSTAAKVGGKPT